MGRGESHFHVAPGFPQDPGRNRLSSGRNRQMLSYSQLLLLDDSVTIKCCDLFRESFCAVSGKCEILAKDENLRGR